MLPSNYSNTDLIQQYEVILEQREISMSRTTLGQHLEDLSIMFVFLRITENYSIKKTEHRRVYERSVQRIISKAAK